MNRTPPKTQAALLQAMQEYRVTAGGETHPLDLPFLVFATQNPIEQEGTYPLPEAQLDRFMFLVDVGYPSAEEEVQIVKSTTSGTAPRLTKILSPEQILALQELVRRVPVPDHVVRYAVELVRHTRPKEPGAPDFVRKHVNWGAGPAGQPVPGGGRQGPGGAPGPLRRLGGGRARPRAARAPPPGAPQLRRGERGHHQHAHRPAAAGAGEGLGGAVRWNSLDAATLAKLAGVKLRARAVMEGVLSGLHKSPHQGQSVEFSEHKEYAPGDELRHLDWKAFGKFDRYYVKRFEHETNLRATLVVDASGSMGYRSGAALQAGGGDARSPARWPTSWCGSRTPRG